jgi:hypothetical protein
MRDHPASSGIDTWWNDLGRKRFVSISLFRFLIFLGRPQREPVEGINPVRHASPPRISPVFSGRGTEGVVDREEYL